MWYRRLNDDETIKTNHYCGMMAKLFANQPQQRSAKWTEINGAEINLVTNGMVIDSTAYHARLHFAGYDFFEARETKPTEPI